MNVYYHLFGNRGISIEFTLIKDLELFGFLLVRHKVQAIVPYNNR